MLVFWKIFKKGGLQGFCFGFYFKKPNLVDFAVYVCVCVFPVDGIYTCSSGREVSMRGGENQSSPQCLSSTGASPG